MSVTPDFDALKQHALVAAARKIAFMAHAGQEDKSGSPYIFHVQRVAESFTWDVDLEAETVAWLHDVLEDAAPVYGELIDRLFPAHIVSAVRALDRTGLNPSDYYRAVRANPLALKVKLADIADNADEDRLAKLDVATRTRLRDKYLNAWKALQGNPHD